ADGELPDVQPVGGRLGGQEGDGGASSAPTATQAAAPAIRARWRSSGSTSSSAIQARSGRARKSAPAERSIPGSSGASSARVGLILTMAGRIEGAARPASLRSSAARAWAVERAED